MDTQSTNSLDSQADTNQQSDDASKICQTATLTATSQEAESNSQQSGASSLPQWIALTQQDVLESRMVGIGRFAADMIDICKGVENIDHKTLCQIVASLARLAEEHAECKVQ